MYKYNSQIRTIKNDENIDDYQKPYLFIRDGSSVFALNYTAGIILEKIKEKDLEFEELINELSCEFELSEDITNDVQDILKTYVERGWIKKC